MLIRTAEGWAQLAPLPPGAIAARDQRDRMAAEIKALCPGQPNATHLATQMLAELLARPRFRV